MGTRNKNSGYLVKWTNSKGIEKFGVAPHAAQEEAFQKIGKVFVRHMQANLNDFERDEHGKKIVSLVKMGKLKVIGMAD